MKKLLNLGLILTFMLGYMEWGQGQSAFVGQIQYEVFFGRPNWKENLAHPVLLAGFTGQLCLLYAMLAPRPRPWVNHLGVALLSLVMLLLFAVAVLAANPRMMAFNLLFLPLAGYYAYISTLKI